MNIFVGLLSIAVFAAILTRIVHVDGLDKAIRDAADGIAALYRGAFGK
jgi:hypothetical protein